MISIGLICEGVSDVKMISHIIQRYLGDVNINPIQPKIVDDKQDKNSHGGWMNVITKCEDKDLQEVFKFNDYLVIQIDTDTCNLKNYDINAYDKYNKKVSNETLYSLVVECLKKHLTIAQVQHFYNKIIFAICIDEIECWFLPLFYSNDPKKCCATTNCIYNLNEKLKQKNIEQIPDNKIKNRSKNDFKAQKAYQSILNMLKKKKDIVNISKYNYGFKQFIKQLKQIAD